MGIFAVLYADGAGSKKFAKYLERVLIVDPQPPAARLLNELLKDSGARFVRIETSLKGAMAAARDDDPQIIFTEFRGPMLDGLAFVRQLRRSELHCRKAPVIMVTAEATASSIIGARDVGVHEFLRKPFTIKDLVRRLEAVTGRPRDWVEGVGYVGPDRRRFNSGDYQGPRKRKSDIAATPESVRVDQAMRILKSAIGALESDPRQALRAMQAQAIDLIRSGGQTGDTRLASAAQVLRTVVEGQMAAGQISRHALETALKPLWGWLPADAA